MGSSRRRWKLSNFQILLILTIGITYLRLYASHLFNPGWLGDCEEMDEELLGLQDALTKCKAEVVERRKLATTEETAGKERGARGGRTTRKAAARQGLLSGMEEESLLADWRASLGDCTGSEMDLKQFVRYAPHVECPDDWPLAQRLMWQNSCHSLPRRNCFAPMPPSYTEPHPFPEALWKVPEKANVRWQHYDCDSFECLAREEKGCFQLDQEKHRWLAGGADVREGALDMPAVIALKRGGIRLGFDVGGGTGCFAAQMASYNVTILTSGMNSGAPSLETMALRGLLSLHLAHKARLPFFDSCLDLIHSRRSIDSLSPDEFELMMFDWDRVLRPGGLLWIEDFIHPQDIMGEYVARIRMLGYQEHEWVLEETLANSQRLSYLTAVLEKPHAKTP